MNNEIQKLNLFLEQYKRCYQTWIHLNSLAWQVPASTFAVTLAVISLSYQYLTSPLVRGITFLLNAVYCFLMLVQMAAHRRGLDGVSAYMKHIEQKVFNIQTLPTETNEIVEFIEKEGWLKKDFLYHKFLIKRRAYYYFQYGLLSASVLLITLGFANILLASLSERLA